MNSDDMTPSDHESHSPEALAAYVDGTDSAQERAATEALMRSCSACREEADLARTARATLRSVGELAAPGIADELELPGARRFGGRRRSPVHGVSTARGWTWERVVWGGTIAAAAAFVGIFVFLQLGGGSRDLASGPGSRPAAAPEGGSTSAGGKNHFTPASLDALARQLASADQRPLSAPDTPSTQPTRTSAKDSRVPRRAAACLRRGAGLGSGQPPIHFEDGYFEQTRAFIGAFRVMPKGASTSYLVVVAVDRSSCSALYVVNHSL